MLKATTVLIAKIVKQTALKKMAKPPFKMALPFGAFCHTLALCFSIITLSSCSFNPNLQGKGEPSIQGSWLQDTTSVQQKLVTSSRYHVRFDCDSFFVQIENRSRVNYGSDSCMRSGHWSEYVKGGYTMRHDTLLLKGLFCNADFSYKSKTDCFRTGPYEEFFTLDKKSDSLIQLVGPSSVIPVQLHLIKKTTCIPKAL